MSKRFAVVLVCAALAGCGMVRQTPTTGRGPLRAKETPASNRHAAHADARRLLSLLVLPAGAIRSPSAPPSSLAHPGDTVATPNLVDVHAWWRAKGTMSGVIAFIEHHAPRGAQRTGIGRLAHGSTIVSRELTFSWPSMRGVRYRALVVDVAPLAHGNAGVRADAQDIWITPRPVSERVPAQARMLTVTRGWVGRKPSLSFTTTNAAKVREIAAMLDGLPIGQPGVFNCPSIPAAPTVTFTFRARRGGAVLAKASTLASGPRGECPGITFKVHGRAQRPLSAQPNFLREAGQVLGVTLLSK